MKAEIIAIGTEITSGQKLDTNSQWLSRQLAELGIAVHYHTTVADDLDANVSVIRTAIDRADVVMLTGGLGPTKDDLTREAVVQAVGVSLSEDPGLLAAIREMFASRGRAMPESNRVQALVPDGATPLPNAVGTAPGFWMSIPRDSRMDCLMAAFPGVPSEMKPMFRTQVIPRLTEGGSVIQKLQINCFGLGESQTEEILGDLTQRGSDPDVGITAHEATISLRIIAQGESSDACQTKIDRVQATIQERIGEYIFGTGEGDIEAPVLRELAQLAQTVSVCESATNGNLIQRIELLDGVQGVCRGGVVAARIIDVEHILGLNAETPALSCSEDGLRFAKQMAIKCRERFQTDFALSVTPWGESQLEGEDRTISAAWVGLAGRDLSLAKEAKLTGNPAIFASRTAKVALDLLRRQLFELPAPR